METQVKTEGIVLTCVKYGDNSVIVNILTEKIGRQAYLIGIQGKRRRTMLPLLQPLTVVNLEVSNSNRSQLQKIREAHIALPLTKLPFDPVRRSIAMFMTELLVRSLHDEMPEGNFYEFVRNSVLALDEGMPGIYNFHIYFMLRLARMLGFEPDLTPTLGNIFDLVGGTFTSQMPLHKHVLTGDDALLWSRLAELNISDLSAPCFTRTERQRMLSLLESYYTAHIPSFQGLNSTAILSALNDVRE
ncbi:MAG: DNA repair protein RecO [Bacteroidales bacterium]|nr:DNA repair protein RecO [Bacteroidales bacterium]